MSSAAEGARPLGRLRTQPQDGADVGVEVKRRLDERQPRVLDGRLEVLDETLGPLEPPVGDGVDAPHRSVVPRQEAGVPRRLARLPGLAPQDECALARGDRRVHVVVPPAGHGEALQGLGGLLGLQRPRVVLARLHPVPAAQGRAARAQRVIRHGLRGLRARHGVRRVGSAHPPTPRDLRVRSAPSRSPSVKRMPECARPLTPAARRAGARGAPGDQRGAAARSVPSKSLRAIGPMHGDVAPASR